MKGIGVNISGFFQGISGLSEATRSTARALQSVGVSTALHHSPKLNADKDPMVDNGFNDFSEHNPYPINLIHVNHSIMEDYLKIMPHAYFEGKYNIAVWAWEMANPPDHVLPLLAFLDEIWVPSYFCVEAMLKISPKPVLRFMHPIDFAPNHLTRKELKLPLDKFIFLTIFDALSLVGRKNPMAAIEAFLQAFGADNSSVLLVIKSMNFARFPTERKCLSDLIAPAKNILWIDEALPKEELVGLIKNCDAYVSLHRCEGFGLTLAEAMYFGKAVIGTGYSGNMDFMNSFNSYPVAYQLVPDEQGQLKKGELWADVSMQDAAEKMKQVYVQREQAVAVGRKAAEDVHCQLSLLEIGQQMKNRLAIIQNELLNNANPAASAIIALQVENSALKQKVKSIENTLTNRFIDGIKYLLAKILR